MATVAKVSSKTLIRIFKRLGRDTADSWAPAKMREMLPKLPGIARDEKDLFDKLKDEYKATIKEIEDCLADGEEPKITFDKPEAASESGDKSAKKEGKKVKDKDKKKSKKTKAGTGNNLVAAGKNGKPGVMASIKEFLTEKASKEKPLHRDKLVDLLAKRFPDRNRDSMRVTVMAWIPTRFLAHNINLKGDKDNGFWIASGKKKDKSEKSEGKKSKKEEKKEG